MLVRGGVEDDLGTVARERRLDALVVADVAHDRVHRVRGALRDDLVVDEVQAVLGVVEQHELGGPELRHLAHEFGADRAAGAGDEDALAAQERADFLEVELHGLAPEQVLDADVAHLRERRTRAVAQVREPRQRLHAHAGLGAHARDLAQHAARDVGVRHDDHLDVLLAQHRGQVRDGAEHLEAFDQVAGQALVVVEEADGHERFLARDAPPHFLHEVDARVVRADHERRHRVATERTQHAFAHEAPREADATDEQQFRHPHERDHARRELAVRHEEQQHDERHRRQRRALEDLEQRHGARVAPEAVIEPREEEREQAQQREGGRDLEVAQPEAQRDLSLEPQVQRGEVRQVDDRRVHDRQHEEAWRFTE